MNINKHMKNIELYESFQTKDEISKICKKYNIENWSISSDGLVDVVGNVDLEYLELPKLPLKFGKIDGSFSCSHNKLTTLEGAPQSVSGNFRCRVNLLTSLEGAPQKVGGYFYCDFNRLISLKGAPLECGAFHLNSTTIENYKYPKSLLEILAKTNALYARKETKQLILTIMSADYFNKQLIENPEKTIMSLKSVWNDPEFKEIRKDIIIPAKYKDMLKLTTNLADIGF